MTVKSRRIGGAAPLDRAILDSAASPVRVLFGVLFLGWSWVSTVLIVGAFLAPAFTASEDAPVPTSYLIGFGFAFLVSVVEFVAAGRWPIVYAVVLLILDAPFTTYQTHQWLTSIVSALTMVGTMGAAVMWAVSLVCGIVAAIFGEVLLFGRR